MPDSSPNPARSEKAAALWAVADDLLARAFGLEEDAGKLRAESRRIKNIAAAIADGRPVENEL